MTSFASPVGRILIAAIFVMSGLQKITAYTGTQGYMESMGVPGALLPLVILLEVGGGLAIILGWFTRIAAVLLALFCLATAMVFHYDFADQTQMSMFMKNLAIAGGFLFLVANGPGSLSINKR